MRREPTDAERKLWFLLRDRGLASVKFRRRVLVGRYVVDFICLRQKLIVEADGGQHSENEADATRDGWLEREGYTVVRYSNIEILKNPRGVLEDLALRLRTPSLGSLRSPRPPSPP
jgi:very-short-patch-repair endonuclease